MFDLDFADDPLRGAPGQAAPIWLEIHGPINRELADRIQFELEQQADARELHLDVYSPGGELASAFDIYASIRNHRAAGKTAFISQAKSSAVLIAMAAERRVLLRNGAMLLHGCQQTPIGRWTASQHEAAAATCRWWDGQLAKIFAHRTGKPAECFLVEMETEGPATTEWLIQNNIITEVKGPT